METHADFILKAVAPLTEPAEPFDEDRHQPFDRRPTLVNDRHLTPEVRGITDQATRSSHPATSAQDAALRPTK